ncbi:hypothetical protein Agub_g3360 [Astrephomene gubernaculifera]|uniref:DUF676 domain-containing protein n=1 Tax=Astrephomene gubernaculifera TaxID=47775 RepID=A0AAD3HJ03_9CHLO|nr:hypothetical protein Agub_g3360 [Astrephomene gubernaculifera]
MHLVVIQHGLWGQPANTAYLATLLRERLGDDYDIINSDVNCGNLTYDGVDVCGDRLHELIVARLEALAAKSKPAHAISMIGYSMGGLVTRYVAGKLYAEGRFATITPVNFITVATPHLGAWRMPSTWYNRAFNYMVPVVTSRSGYQMVLQDKHLWDKPLLCLLSHPDLPFMRALRTFKKLMLLANVFHDRPVPYCTAAIRLDNPYEGSLPVALNPKYPSIVCTAPAAAAAAAAAAAVAATVSTGAAGPAATAVGPKSPANTKSTDPGAADIAAKAGSPNAAHAAALATAVTVVTAAAVQPHGPTAANGDCAGTGCSGSHGTPQEPYDPHHTPQHLQQPQSKKFDPQMESASQQQPPHGLQAEGGPHGHQHPHKPLPRRPLRSKYLPVISVLCLPLAVPVLALMVVAGRSHHCKMMRTALDFSWIQRHYNRRRDIEGEGAPGGRERPGVSPSQQQLNPDDAAGGDIQCPSAPELPVNPPAAGAGKDVASSATAVAPRSASSSAAPASQTAPGALDDGCDEVVVSEQGVEVLLHDGVVELPAQLHRVQEWLVEQLNQLPWHKVDVDCRDLHAHAAIINRNPARFHHTRDVLEYLADNFMRS